MAKRKPNKQLEEYPLGYELPEDKRPPARRKTTPAKPTKNYTFKVRKVIEGMAKPKTKYAPSRIEVAKTVMIAVLITAVITFVAGMQFQKSQEAEVRNAVQAVETELSAKK